jgi:hypothetical protein
LIFIPLSRRKVNNLKVNNLKARETGKSQQEARNLSFYTKKEKENIFYIIHLLWGKRGKNCIWRYSWRYLI